MSSTRLTGRTKWFNSKAGYGFITVCDNSSEHFEQDIFAHFSAIHVENQYKYLVQGEYVEFELKTVEDGKHKFHADNISGIKGGLLMCQTQNQRVPRRVGEDNKATVTSEKVTTEEGEFVKVVHKRQPRARRDPAKKE